MTGRIGDLVSIGPDRLRALRDELGAVELALELDGSAEATTVRDELVGQIDDYLLPRLDRLDAPVLVVLGGSTGAGKSTLANSIAGANLSAAGVLRPSTRSPVLISHPVDRAAFEDGGVLPDLPRSRGDRDDGSSLRLASSERLPVGLAVLDTPDIDSVEIANHELAAKLLGAADVWLFVTTASRYADAVPWDHLRRARARAVALAIVVNRIPPGARDEVVEHLGEMLDEHGLAGTRLFPVAERRAGELEDGRLRGDELEVVVDWLAELVTDSTRRDELVRSSVRGAIGSIPGRVEIVTDAMGREAEVADRLAAASRRHYDDALAQIDGELASGELLRGEVLDRWREQVGGTAVMDRLQAGIGRLRSRMASVVTGRQPVAAATSDQIESNLEVLVRATADRAALATVTSWEQLPGGQRALDGAGRGIDRAGPALAGRLADQFDRWQEGVLDIVRRRSGRKVAVARTMSVGVNGLGVALMVGVFSQTGGLTGAEAGVAAGTAAVNQALLSAFFGDRAVRELIQEARRDLAVRLDEVFEQERARFDELLAPASDAASVERLLQTTARLVA